MFTSVNARLLRSQEFQEVFSPDGPSYFSKEGMLIRQTDLDHHLASKGFSRKHIPYEPSSLFRCLAERLYNSQQFWSTKIKFQLLQYFKKNRIGSFVQATEDLDKLISCVEKVDESCDRGPTLDDALTLLPFIADCFAVKIVLFREDDPAGVPIQLNPREDADEGFTSHGQEIVRMSVNCSGHFDIVLTLNEVANRAMVQAMIHEILYVHVFKYPQEVIRQTVVEMLQEKKYARLRVERKRYARHRALYGMPVDDLPEKLSVLPPISYKDAKALDLALFRNITMDIWLQKNRDRFIAMKLAELQPGDRCVLTFSGRQGGRKALCTIIQKDDDHRFQVELSDGQQVTVPVRELELLSKRKERHATYSAGNTSRTSEIIQSSPEVSPAITASPVFSSNNSQVGNHTGQVWYPPLDLHTGGWFDPCLQFFPPIDYFSYHTAYSTAQHASVSGGQQMLSFPFPLQMIQYPYLGV